MTDLRDSVTIWPGDWLGMLGGGQLGRMFCHAAQRMGYRVAVLDPDPDSPAGTIADMHIRCGYDDRQGLEQLAQQCQAITTEFENIPADSLAVLAETVQVRPGSDAVAVTQDRIREKSFFVDMEVPVAPYVAVHSLDDINNAPDSVFPGILKAARFGYDGKGQARVQDRLQACDAFQQFGQVNCVLEAMLPLACEVSIIIARNHKGAVVCYPPVRNEHRNGILAISTSDALHDKPDLAQQATRIAKDIAAHLGYVGVLCVEFFIVQDGRLIVNEIAPRPHNSGHYTMDASVSSQFEQQVRVLAGMPLGTPDSVQSAVMINILGDIWFTGNTEEPREPAWDQVLALPGVHLHLYGKKSVRKGRKMGHVNVVGATPGQTQDTAAHVARLLHIPFQA